MDNEILLQIKNLDVNFYTQRGVIKAVRDLSFNMNKGETLSLVGESGCGKSVTAHAINQLIPLPGKIENGQVIFEGKDLVCFSEKQICEVRGSRISMIFQEPMTSLNPVFNVGSQIGDVYRTHTKVSKAEAKQKAIELLNLVKIHSPEDRYYDYPHQLSGGMRQRVMIALALASPNPGLLIADEPTTALDVTIQAQILELIEGLKKEINMSLLLITHDMGVVSEVADRVIVMYAGRKMEEGDVDSIFENPSHPYTRGLLKSLPSNPKYRNASRLEAIEGNVPDSLTLGDGCPFESRCSYSDFQCIESFPGRTEVNQNHSLWCHKAKEI